MTKDAEIQEEQAEQTGDHHTEPRPETASEPIVRAVRTSPDLLRTPTATQGPAARGEEADDAPAEAGAGQPRGDVLLDRVLTRHTTLTQEMLQGASEELLWWLYDTMEEKAPASVPPPARAAAERKDFHPKPGTRKFIPYSERK